MKYEFLNLEIATLKSMSVKDAKLFNLIYHHHNFDLYKKRIALWYIAEPGSGQNHAEHFISLIKYLITAGSDINIYVNERSILNSIQSGYAINFFEEMYDCLPHAHTLGIFGKIQPVDLTKARSLFKKDGLTLIFEYELQNLLHLHKC